ncbi:hypothetical protein K7432_002412 [Basidiobolus ranarum]|uniref:SPX domain-containing protein n=1 Tax=Basidiobolus ranarum TaxID=34480 RepID=A0ABR2X1M7_9FUNG
MKFAKQLALRSIPTWAIYYVDYKQLKKFIKESEIPYEEDGKDSAELKKITHDFKALVNTELDKVEERYLAMEKESSDKLNLLKTKWRPDLSPEEQDKWMKDFTKLLQTLEYLSEFTQTNIVGFQKILKKFDKHFNVTWGKDFWPEITTKKFANSEKEENLLHEARQVWRKRVPVAPLEPKRNLDVVNSEIPTVSALDLQSLASGQVHRFWVVLSEDGLNLPIKVPVIIAKGVKPGPTLGITAALHGNELNGIPLIHRLFREVACDALHGIVVAVPVANAPGYLRSQRTFSDGTDLNRLMPGKKNGSTSQVYAYNLMERVVSHFDYLLDLHTASKGRVNSLYVRANMTHIHTQRMATLQNPQIIVHNTSPDGSLRGAAMERGIPAITVEIGDPSRFQKRFVKNALLGVTNIISHLQMVEDEPDHPEYDPVVCSKSYWIFAPSGGILSVLPDVNTWVKRNEPIAYLHNIFGDLEATYYAPEDGIVIGKNVDPVCQSGNRILHLGVVDSTFPEYVNDGHL